MRASKKNIIFLRLTYLSVILILTYALIFDLFDPKDDETLTAEANVTESITNIFGFHSSSFEQQIDKVKKNQTLSDILQNFRLTSTTIHEIANTSKEIFDVRQIKAGKTYHAFTESDTSNSLRYFVYEKDHINYIVYDLRDSVLIYEGKKEVIVKRKTTSAVIDHSLYAALSESDTPAELAVRLSQIFAWQIDFHHLQERDNFKVVYDEEYIQLPFIDKIRKQNLYNAEDDLQFVGLGKIHGVYFQHNRKEFYAIPFIQNNTFQYFDEKGNSLRKAFLKAPLEFGRISSRFSYSRYHPVLHTLQPHLGVDYAAPIGTPVVSTGDGFIVDADHEKSNGKYLKIRHNSVYTTMYLHLSKFAKGIRKGINVKQGQVIGYVGSTGHSTGSHLDYRIFINGKPVDPLKVELPPSHPIDEKLKDEFEDTKNETIRLLRIFDSKFVFETEPYVLRKSSLK